MFEDRERARVVVLVNSYLLTDKHYDNWVHHIRALESETEKAKKITKKKQIDGLKSDVKTLQTQQEGYKQ